MMRFTFGRTLGGGSLDSVILMNMLYWVYGRRGSHTHIGEMTLMMEQDKWHERRLNFDLINVIGKGFCWSVEI